MKDDSEVCGLNKWRNDDDIYGDGKDFKMSMDEGMYTEQNMSSMFVLG